MPEQSASERSPSLKRGRSASGNLKEPAQKETRSTLCTDRALLVNKQLYTSIQLSLS